RWPYPRMAWFYWALRHAPSTHGVDLLGIAVAPSTHGVDLLALRWPHPRMAWIYWHCGGPIHAWRGPLTVNWSRSTPCVDALRAADKKQRRRASCGRRRVPSPGTLPYQRMTSTGSVLRASTSAVWLPSSTRVTPRRPCEVITIRSLLRWPAVSMMPSAA